MSLTAAAAAQVSETRFAPVADDANSVGVELAARIGEISALDGFAVPADIYDEVRFIATSLGLVEAR